MENEFGEYADQLRSGEEPSEDVGPPADVGCSSHPPSLQSMQVGEHAADRLPCSVNGDPDTICSIDQWLHFSF